MRLFAFIVLAAFPAFAESAFAVITNYTNKATWQSAVQQTFVTIDFTGFAHLEPLTDQYASLGILFTDGDDRIRHHNNFPNDGQGLFGNPWSVTVEFEQPQSAIGIEHWASTRFELYYHGASIGISQQFIHSGNGWFSGITSTMPFDKVRIYHPSGGDTNVDDLFFSSIPTPGILPAFGILMLTQRRRRR
jgi:hypothetical protein